MFKEIILLFKKYFNAEDEFNAYRGPDKYSSNTTEFTKEYIRLSQNYFGIQADLEIMLSQIEGHHQDCDAKLYWHIKTWYDIHNLAKDNPGRMIHTNNLSSLCVDVMELSVKSNQELRQYINSI